MKELTITKAFQKTCIWKPLKPGTIGFISESGQKEAKSDYSIEKDPMNKGSD